MKKWKGDILFLLVVGSLVGGWIYLYPHSHDSPLAPIQTPADLSKEVSTYASLEGLELAYRLYEPPEDPQYVLLFLHDTLLHSGWYADLGQRLTQHGVAVYLPDRRGWGHSDGDRRQGEQDKSVLAEDITALISVAQSRYPQKRVFLGGHGRGAGVVLRYVATRRPISGIVLVSPYIAEDQPNLEPRGWQTFVTAHPGEAFLAKSGLTNWPVWRYNWPQSMVEADPTLETRCSIACQQETALDDVDAAYRSVTVPLLCLQGGDDPLFDPAKAADLMALFVAADRQLETLPGVDALSIINVAADPIAQWLADR